MNLPVIQSNHLGNITQVNLIQSFLSGRNKKTIAAYRQDLDDFRAFLNAPSLDDAAAFLLSCGHGKANGIALAYKTNLIDRGLQSATVNRRLAALRSLVKLARTLGMTNYTLEVENMRHTSYRDTKGPGKAGYKTMLNQAATWKKEPKGIRDQAILHLLYDLGLRRGEVVNLDFADLDLNAGTLAILGKGRTEKINLTLPNETKASLHSWVQIRGDEPGPLFLNLDPARKGDGRLTGNGLYRTIKALGKKSGLKSVRPHGLRHSAITEALTLTNGNYRAVVKFSRHANIQTITLYDDNRQDIGGTVAAMVAAHSNI